MWKYKLSMVVVLALVGATSVYGQCKRFHKLECQPTLPESHVLVNQYMLSNFYYGDQASVHFTVNPDRDYMLNLCTQETIQEGTYFTLSYVTGETFYDSRKSDYNTSVIFSSEVPDTYVLSVINEKPRKGEIIPSGCVSVVIGMALEQKPMASAQ